MNEVLVKEVSVKNMIYEIRGKQVMLDSDLARLYQVETKRINEAVKNNPEKFPERFSFKLTDEESEIFKVENFDQKIETRGGRFKNPRVFTEQGVAMLATILKSKVATQISIQIMDAFVEMRKYIATNLIEQKYINNQVMKNTENIEKNIADIKALQESLNKLNSNKSNAGLFFDGQIYDAYSLLLDILGQASKKIIIIDNYVDKNLLDVLAKIDREVLIITNKYKMQDYEKYKRQYKNIKLKINNKIHDRFIIIDDDVLYHSGSSFKDLCTKCFAITKIENKEWLTKLLKWIKGE